MEKFGQALSPPPLSTVLDALVSSAVTLNRSQPFSCNNAVFDAVSLNALTFPYLQEHFESRMKNIVQYALAVLSFPILSRLSFSTLSPPSLQIHHSRWFRDLYFTNTSSYQIFVLLRFPATTPFSMPFLSRVLLIASFASGTLLFSAKTSLCWFRYLFFTNTSSLIKRTFMIFAGA